MDYLKKLMLWVAKTVQWRKGKFGLNQAKVDHKRKKII